MVNENVILLLVLFGLSFNHLMDGTSLSPTSRVDALFVGKRLISVSDENLSGSFHPDDTSAELSQDPV